MDDLPKQIVSPYAGDGTLQSSASTEWCTPQVVKSLVESFWNDVPDFDPCGHPTNLWASLTALLPQYREGGPNGSHVAYRDSLQNNWTGRGRTYMNPPYGRGIGVWCEKLRREADEGIALLPARTDTQWFHEQVWRADALCFWEGRLYFEQDGVRNPAPFPSVIAYYGVSGIAIEAQLSRFEALFSKHGKVLVQP